MYQVKKRDGSLAEFEVHKIVGAIRKAFDACERKYNDQIINLIALQVTSDFEPKIKNNAINVEDIQDSVEKILSNAGYADVAKAYILYRRQRENIRNINATTVDYKNLVDGYLKSSDWQANQNATISYSVSGLVLSNSGAITANYWLNEVYDQEISDAHRKGEMHIHNLTMLTGYCAGWSLVKLIMEGLGGVPDKTSYSPAKHLSAICSQLAHLIGIMQNEWAGAQTVVSLDTYLAPYVKKDQLSYQQVKQEIQAFICAVNVPSRWGCRAPFLNITLDRHVPDDMKDKKALLGGEELDFTYGECQREMDYINKAILETLIEGDGAGRRYQFPIPIYAIKYERDWNDHENNRLLFQLTAKYGIPYFTNYTSSSLDPAWMRKVPTLDMAHPEGLYHKPGSYFASGVDTGSIGSVTINLPRIAYLSENQEDFFQRLDHVMDIAARSLHHKRDVITRLLEAGFYPYTKRYLGTFEHHFSTIGVIGMNEACLNASWIKTNLMQGEAQVFAKEVLQHMLDRLSHYQVLYKELFNLEASPAESTAYRLAQLDRKDYPSIVTSGTDVAPYHTNSSQLPVNGTDDLFEAMDIEETLQSMYTGGTVFHIYLAQALSDDQQVAVLLQKVCEHYTLPYFTITPTYSACEEHGYVQGHKETCPICGKPTEVYSRITGYYRPRSSWNPGKQQEFRDRVYYAIEGGFQPSGQK